MKSKIGVVKELNSDLARQLIEQGLRSMRLLDDNKNIVMILPEGPFKYMEIKEERMVSITLNANKAA